MSLAFFLIFFGLDGVQQFITTHFSKLGLINVGFTTLIIVYLMFVLFEPLGAVITSKFNPVFSMLIGSIGYIFFVYSLRYTNIALLYAAAAWLGFSATLLWTGQNSYLIGQSNKGEYGKNAGYFNTWRTLGSGLGVLVVGYLLKTLEWPVIINLQAAILFAGMLVLTQLKFKKRVVATNHLKLGVEVFKDKLAWRLSLPFFTFMFVNGLVLGYIPLHIERLQGTHVIGIITSMFYLVPLMTTYISGVLSDRLGRVTILYWSYHIMTISIALLFISSTLFMISFGIFLLALASSFLNPAAMAIVGDLGIDSKLPYYTAIIWIMRNLGILSALVLSRFVTNNNLYIFALFISVGSYIVFMPLVSKSSLK